MEPLERRDLPAVTLNAFVVPSTGQKGDAVALSADASSDQAGATLNYAWNFGDGTTASGANLADVTHAFNLPSAAGSPYAVSLTVSDGTSGTATANAPITIADVPPTVALNPGQTVHAGDTVGFNAAVTDPAGPTDVASIQWDFNYNGSTFISDASANGQTSPSHVYATPGTYIVEVQAADLSGAVSVGATSVVVKPADALLVHAGPDQTVTEGGGMMGYGSATVAFAGGYNDPGGTVAPGGIAWDFNYNGTFSAQSTGTLTPTWTYYGTGVYQAALQITDGNGATDLDVMQVQVVAPQYVGPTATAGPNQTVNEGGTVSFNGSYSDPDGTVYSSNVAWDFNYDGSTFNAQSTGTRTPTYQFSTPGTYVVALQVTDSNGLSSLDTLNVTVNGVAPTVSVWPPSSPIAGVPTSLYGSASGPGAPYSYAWDFHYDGTTFNPGAADSSDPEYTFAAPRTYTVALQASDAYGDSALGTATFTVAANPALVVNAGPDPFVNAGDAVSFNGAYVDNNPRATVDPTTAAWDFNYNGSFAAQTTGTLTPTHVFTQPGDYLVALQLTDSNGSTSTGLLYVAVTDAPPTVSAGPDQTAAEGTAVSFSGTATDPLGSSNLAYLAWDFNYDGSHFNSDSSANGTLTPSHTFTAPGTYEVALQVTDDFGESSLSTALVTVTDVAPTGTVGNGGGVEGSAVTFTVSNVQDLDPADTVTYLADWTGGGQFQMLTPDQIATSNGSVRFSHTYDVAGTYHAVIELVDGSGGLTDYASTVTVTAAAPTATYFGPEATPYMAFPGSPFVFTGVNDASNTEAAAGYTYYVNVNNAPYVESSSPVSTPLSGAGPGEYYVTGYVVNAEGVASAVASAGVYLLPQTLTTVSNQGSGAVQLSWDGGSFTLGGGEQLTLDGEVQDIGVTLLNSDAVYLLSTNSSFGAINAAAGVQDVALEVVTTQMQNGNLPTAQQLAAYLTTPPTWPSNPTTSSGPGWTETPTTTWEPPAAVGDGSVGVITLPTAATLDVYARGDFAGVAGPTDEGGSVAHTQALDLAFANLTGSISGLDRVQSMEASGWLGTGAGQQVTVNGGIGSLTAYGVGATVQADLRQDANDLALWLSVGVGGITSTFEAGNVYSASVAGNVNVFDARALTGEFTAGVVQQLALLAATASSGIDTTSIDLLLFPESVEKTDHIKEKTDLNKVISDGSLDVTHEISAGHIVQIDVQGNLTAEDITATTDGIDRLHVGNGCVITDAISAEKDIGAITVGAGLTAETIVSWKGSVGPLTIGNANNTSPSNLETSISAKQDVKAIQVYGDFVLPPGIARVVQSSLIHAEGNIGDVTVTGTIGTRPSKSTSLNGTFVGVCVGNVTAEKGDIALVRITATAGNVGNISAGPFITAVDHALEDRGVLFASVTALDGDIKNVKARSIQGSLTAKAQVMRLNGMTVVTGGNIWSVTALTRISGDITAQELLGLVKVLAPDGNQYFNVTAQAGAASGVNAIGARQPLTINVGSVFFEGQVNFDPVVPAIPYTDKAPLLILFDAIYKKDAAGNPEGMWTVSAPAGAAAGASTTVSNLLFDWSPPDLNGPWLQGLRNPTAQHFNDQGWTVVGPK